MSTRQRSREQRAFNNGVFVGKFGIAAAESPYDVDDYSAVAQAWRRGWVVGNTAFRQAVASEPICICPDDVIGSVGGCPVHAPESGGDSDEDIEAHHCRPAIFANRERSLCAGSETTTPEGATERRPSFCRGLRLLTLLFVGGVRIIRP